MKKILVIGSSNTDMIIYVSKIPAQGETVIGDNFMVAQGGKGANQAVAAARAGGDVTFIACLGKDDFANQAMHHYMNNKINVENIIYDDCAPTGVACIFVAKDGENSIAVASGANARLSPQHILKKQSIVNQANILLLQLEIPLPTVAQAIDIAYHSNIPIVLNPAPAQCLPIELLQKITILTPNQSEAEILTGLTIVDTNSAQQAAKYLLDQGINNVIITLGEKGALVAEKNKKIQLVPRYRVNAIDTTGAGDTFNGALSVAYSEGKSLVEAAQFANAAAALSTTSHGAQPSIPTRENIESLWTSAGWSFSS